MWRSIMLKEWLKLRWAFSAALVLNAAFCLQILLDLRQQLAAEHAEMVWYQMIHLHTLAQHGMRYAPLLTGIALAAAQFVPELLGRRMRLSLHLPVSRNRMLLYSLLAGLLLLVSVIALIALLSAVTMRYFFPVEAVWAVQRSMLPWFLAGLLAYLGGATVLLEPAWTRRAILVVVFGVLIRVLLGGRGYDWFTAFWPWLLLPAPLALTGVFESARRFQRGGI